eukprot:scpid69510/ scgid10726/ 
MGLGFGEFSWGSCTRACSDGANSHSHGVFWALAIVRLGETTSIVHQKAIDYGSTTALHEDVTGGGGQDTFAELADPPTLPLLWVLFLLELTNLKYSAGACQAFKPSWR